MNPYHRRLERHYSESLIAAMRARGVYEAMDTGTPATLDLSFGGPGLIGCTLQFDFTKDKTRDDRARSLYAFFTRAVARLVAAHIAKEEAAKVARCNNCSQWFPSFAERNRHRTTVHRMKANEPTDDPASEQTIRAEVVQ